MPVRTLAALGRALHTFDSQSAKTKLRLLRALEHGRLPTAKSVERLHELLCFMRAHSDDARVHARVVRMLSKFPRRDDLRAHANALADTGILGTAITYRFFWPMAQWLASRWPGLLHLDRSDTEADDAIRKALPLIVSRAEVEWLRGENVSGYEALDRLRGRRETDAAFLVRHVSEMPGDGWTREAVFDGIDATFELRPGRDTPSRTAAHVAGTSTCFQTTSLHRTRPNLRAEMLRPPQQVRTVSARAGSALIDLARCAMVTRARDLMAFEYADCRDVRIVDDGRGLCFALMGVLPERRAPLPATYGALTIRNGVPIGYVQIDAIAGMAAISFNTFETFRGAEAAHTFARMLAMVRHVFHTESFSIEPYQLGIGNDEGIDSGAWWFYYKLGFRPRAPAARGIAKRELVRMRSRPDHRSSASTLRRLAAYHLFFDADPGRVRPLPDTLRVAREMTAQLAAMGDTDRRGAVDRCSARATERAGLRSLDGFTKDERRAWREWSPVVATLRGLSTWSARDRADLVAVIRAKAGRRESDYVRQFDAHPRLAAAIFAKTIKRSRRR